MRGMIDISVPVGSGIPVWPGSEGARLSWTSRIDDGGLVNSSRLECDIHVGTHVDAPLHFLAGGGSVEDIALDACVGNAWVAELPEVGSIRADDLEAAGIPSGAERLLLRTGNSALWDRHGARFYEDFAALAPDAAHWIVERGIRLVGIDYLSIQRFEDGPETHRVLLGAEVVILEGIRLDRAPSGWYELLCLPVLLAGAEGAPARAVLRARCE